MNGRMLITGASGFLGYHLVKAATKRGLDVDAGIRAHSDVSHLKDMGVRFVDLPYESPERLGAMLTAGNYQYIIHAAAVTRAKRESAYQRVNVDYAENIARASVQTESVKSFVFISSLAAIGPIPYGENAFITEQTELRPVTQYGESKRRAEQRLKAIAGLPLAIIRPTAVYGPRERDLLVLFKTILRGVDAYIGRKPQRLSFVHAADLADVIMAAAQRRTEKQDETTCYNISDGEVYGRYEIADILAGYRKVKPVRMHLPVALVRMVASGLAFAYRWSDKVPVLYPERIGELTAPNWACDITKAKMVLGFRPRFTLRNGLEQTITWYRTHHWI